MQAPPYRFDRAKCLGKNCPSVAYKLVVSYHARVTTPAVNSFLGSLGVGAHDEMKMMSKEADEVSQLRKEFDTMKMMRHKKEKDLRILEEQLSDIRAASKGHESNTSAAHSSASQLEHRTKVRRHASFLRHRTR